MEFDTIKGKPATKTCYGSRLSDTWASELVGARRFVFTKNLYYGDSGDDVVELQKFLKRKGYFKREPTGYFGTFTRDALHDFQEYDMRLPFWELMLYGGTHFGPKSRKAANAVV